MSISLPAAPDPARSLAAVMPAMIDALDGRTAWLKPARSAILLVVDGLGVQNLRARSGHARFLSAAGGRRDVTSTVFPATTAAALTTLCTGVLPGEHGVVGYRVRVPETGVVVNQLKGWDAGLLDPHAWQRAEPLLHRESRVGRPCFVVSKPVFERSGLTTATLRGAHLQSAPSLDERVRIACDLAARHPGALVYVYTPHLDAVGHKNGCESEEWSAALEDVDRAVVALAAGLARGVGALVTADHGMVDVPAHRHVLLREGDDLLEDVAAVGGEPRMLHLYARAGRAAGVLDRWRRSQERVAWVMSRDEAVSAGLFGPVHPDVLPRIGDVLVAARANVAYYDDRETDRRPQSMRGQHGSLTDAERQVPLIRLGAFA